MEKIIIVNSGSASAKYALFEGVNLIAFYHYERDDDACLLNKKIGDDITITTPISKKFYEDSFTHFVDDLILNKLIESQDEISKIALRIVAPGKFFQEDGEINKKYLSLLDQVKNHSPIHVKNLMQEIGAIRERLPKVKMVAISDSAFHKTQPEWQKIYPLPKKIVEELHLYRYGYHGLSVESVLNLVKSKFDLPPNVVVCHLGGGSSISAIKDGKSIYNSMGYSPMSGLIMSSRAGDLDPEVIFSIMDGRRLNTSETRAMISKESGLLGISGVTTEARVLVEKMGTDIGARDAIVNYVFSIKKQIGICTSLMNGLDLLIFTGTIGERSSTIKRMICENMEFFGIKIDQNQNLIHEGVDGFINDPESSVSVYTCHSREMQLIAEKAQAL